MEIGDKLEFVLVNGDRVGGCDNCAFRHNQKCPANLCGKSGIFKLLPKQNHITFKNVSSNIRHNDKGEPSQIELHMPIVTKEDRKLALRLYMKDGDLSVDICLEKEE